MLLLTDCGAVRPVISGLGAVLLHCTYVLPAPFAEVPSADAHSVWLADSLRLHALAYNAAEVPTGSAEERAVPHSGEYHYRSAPGSEAHLNDPQAMAKLQAAAQVRRGPLDLRHVSL